MGLIFLINLTIHAILWYKMSILLYSYVEKRGELDISDLNPAAMTFIYCAFIFRCLFHNIHYCVIYLVI